MFVVNLLGRLGNQMFEYGFAKMVSNKTKSLFLFDNPTSFLLPYYFRINKFPVLYNYIPLFRIWIRKWIQSLKKLKYLDYTDCNSFCDSMTIRGDMYYEGYFQSLGYFYGYEDKLKNIFSLRRIHVNKFQKIYGETFKVNRTVVIHVRRTDYLQFGQVLNFSNHDVSLPISYYNECLKQIIDINEYKLYIIGDDRNFMLDNFSNMHNVEIPQNEMIIDLQLMMNADIVVMSNSTFAWWGAFLNLKKNKKVFAPRNFLGRKEHMEFPRGIYKGLCSYTYV